MLFGGRLHHCRLLGVPGPGEGAAEHVHLYFPPVVLVLPLAYLFSLTGELNLVWWSFPVAEVLAGALAAFYLRRAYRRVIRPLAQEDYRF